MFGENLRHADANPLESLIELQRLDAASEGRDRSSERVGIQCRVELRPGNSRDRSNAQVVNAACSDLSSSGCRLIAPLPPAVGDVYLLSFEESVALPNVFARCVRCRLLKEDAYEAGFQFFTELTLPGAQDASESDLVDMI